VNETVAVTAAAQLLEAETSSIGQFVERATVANMPLQSRRSASLVRLMGTWFITRKMDPSRFPVHYGWRTVDEPDVASGWRGSSEHGAGVPQLSLNPPAESLQEFRAEVSDYSAEFGRSGNGTIIMTTRSGTNELHGAGYEFLRTISSTAGLSSRLRRRHCATTSSAPQ